MSDQSSGGQADRISAEIAAVCGELLISPESAIRHTRAATDRQAPNAPSRTPVRGRSYARPNGWGRVARAIKIRPKK